MKFGVLNKSTVLNRFVLHTLQRNITRLAVITRKTNIKLGILKRGSWKRAMGFFTLLRLEKLSIYHFNHKFDCESILFLCSNCLISINPVVLELSDSGLAIANAKHCTLAAYL